jgi:IMP dehydrogenase
MPLTNGDVMGESAFFGPTINLLDHTKALQVLKDYESKDGLNITELLDSKKHGGLTYNDFLVLPGP